MSAGRKPEQVLWDRLSARMHGRWLADRIENHIGRSVPDVYFIFEKSGDTHPAFGGWIELKQIFEWNRQKKRPTRVNHFTHGQKRWLASRHRAGANCWLLLYIRATDEYIFITGDKAGCVGSVTQEEVYINASAYFQGMPSPATIRGILEEGARYGYQK